MHSAFIDEIQEGDTTIAFLGKSNTLQGLDQEDGNRQRPETAPETVTPAGITSTVRVGELLTMRYGCAGFLKRQG